jgi:hypothetical protein
MKLISMGMIGAVTVVSALALAESSRKPAAPVASDAAKAAPGSVLLVTRDDAVAGDDGATVAVDQDDTGVAAAPPQAAVTADADDATPVDTWADGPPPADRYEDPGVPPDDGDVWVPGCWEHRRGLYFWVPGRWIAQRVGYDYVAAQWVHSNGLWVRVAGSWAPSRGGNTATPPRGYQPAHPSSSEGAPTIVTPATPSNLAYQPSGPHATNGSPPVHTTHTAPHRAAYGEGDPSIGNHFSKSSYGEGDPRPGDPLGMTYRPSIPQAEPHEVRAQPAMSFSRPSPAPHASPASPSHGGHAFHGGGHHGGGGRH